MNAYQKAKNPSKQLFINGPILEEKVLSTMRTISEIVGSTLGPAGRPVLIERQEYGLPHMFTKDGVTVFRSLGFDDPTSQAIMEAARDASVRTASEAGDGPQPLWSKILTPNGFINMGDIEVGMQVCGTNGTIQTVEGIFEKGEKELIEVTFSEGRKVECSWDHLWSVTTSWGSKKTLTTFQLQEEYKTKQPDSSYRYKFFTPRTPVELVNTQTLPLDPYLVGILLGDGSLSDSGSIELSLGKNKEHILSKIVLPKGIKTNVVYYADKNAFRVKINGKTDTGMTIRDFLDLIGLRNADSYTKYIPKNYLCSSIIQRKALLQGMVDTDGHINTRGRFEFSTVNPRLAEDFIFLARSLGYSLHNNVISRKDGDGSYSKKDIFRIVELKGDKYGNKIVDIKSTGRFTEMRCIKVSNPDHLYITDNFITTHNTTTATVLAESIVRNTSNFCKKNPRVSPQRVVRRLEQIFKERIEPCIRDLSIKPTEKMLNDVARISANGDVELANVVMDCFDQIGDDGNIIITEQSGPSEYQVEYLKGFPINAGYEESCGKFFPLFLNDKANSRTFLEKPVFVLYNGAITQTQTIEKLMQMIGSAWENPADFGLEKPFNYNVVIIATGFSETLLGDLSVNFSHPHTINVFPLMIPRSPIANGDLHALLDLSAVTGAKVFDPITAPLDTAKLEDLGYGITSFEVNRYRSTILGLCDESLIEIRADEVKGSIANAASKMDEYFIVERLAKLTGGIAKLKVIGPSSGELREKRDRAEDATFAVRGARKHGCLPGGCWTLAKLASDLVDEFPEDKVVNDVIFPSFLEPLSKILSNAGLHKDEADDIVWRLLESIDSKDPATVYDAMELKWVDAVDTGLLDSTPAVLEAIRNSISIASLLGTLGGTVVYKRDAAMEREEAESINEFMSHTGQ